MKYDMYVSQIKWVEAFPMPNQEAHTVADILTEEVIWEFH